jgi:hypothetical protein
VSHQKPFEIAMQITQFDIFSKTFFTNGPVRKHISDMHPSKGTSFANALIELRGAKDFGVLPSTSEHAKIEECQSYW